MTQGKPQLPWPGEDEKIVVEEMLSGTPSEHWYECREFVKKRVQMLAWLSPADKDWDFSLDEIAFYKGTAPIGPVGVTEQ